MKMKKLLCCVFAALLTCSLFACDGGVFGGTKDSASTLNIHYVAGGFDGDYQEKLTEDYKALTGVTVKWNASYKTGEIQSLLNTKQETNDIVMPLLNMYQAQDGHLLENLNDVYDTVPEGSTEPIKTRMNQSLYEYFGTEDGNYYQMPGLNSVSALCYNIDTLNEAFGEGKWTLPRTTAELKKLADSLKQKDVYAFSTDTDINYYWDYLGLVWWAQYDGMETFSHYYKAEAKNEQTGNWEVSKEINNLQGRKIALQTLGNFMSSRNGYMHAYAEDMNYTQAQRAFLGGGYDDDEKKVAFMVNGDWLEQEMMAWLMANPQKIGMMRAPVISDLANKLTTVNGDTALSAVVEAVDNGAQSAADVTAVAGLSEDDFAAVRTARRMGYTATPNYPIGIPANRPESKKKMAKDFLVYLYSDRAQRIMATGLRGLTYPAGYDALADDSVQVSDFVRTRLTNYGKDMIAVFPHCVSPAVYRGGLSELPAIGNTIDSTLYKGTSADTILSKCATDLDANWENIIKWLKTDSSEQA